MKRFDSSTQLETLDAVWRSSWAPPPRMTVSEWADQRRMLSEEASVEPGRWKTARAEYQREIMDSVLDPDNEETVFKKSSQVGASEILNNVLGYFIDLDPSPMLMVQPTVDLARDYSKDRVAPMLRDTPALTSKVTEASRDSENTILHKKFRGGHLTMGGANSPASLASRPIRILVKDEVDRYPPSAGREGDPAKLADKRTQTFWNRVRYMSGTPTIKGASRIDYAFERSTQERFHVPCHACGEKQVLVWAQVKWESKPVHKPETAYYECEHCSAPWNEAQRLRAVRQGEWVAEQPGERRRGFHVWEAYSPWSSLEKIVVDFLDAKDDPEQLKVWTNTTLGECWEEGTQTAEPNVIYETRRTQYGPEVPGKAVLVTVGGDLQVDRWELETLAHAPDGETWQLAYDVIPVDPKNPADWTGVDDVLSRDYKHESGVTLHVAAACLDSGNWTDEVYRFCKKRQLRRVWAVKGRGGQGLPSVVSQTRRNKHRCLVTTIGVDGLKRRFLSRLIERGTPGPGFQHFPLERQLHFFEQLTSEKPVRRYHRGRPIVEWVAKSHVGHEPLDCRVYNLAAVAILNPVWARLEVRLQREADRLAVEEEPEVELDEDQPLDYTRREMQRRRRGRAGRGGRNPTKEF